MKSNDEWSIVGSSRRSSVVSARSKNSVASGSSTFDFVNFKKPPRNIIITKESINDQKLAKQKRRQQIAENEREQQRLDLDVILSGFPAKPECKTVAEKFLSIQLIPIEKVRTIYQFENKTNDGTFYHIVITFKDKSAKSQLLKTHAGLRRGIRWIQLKQNIPNDQIDTIIKCHSRFSKFNFGVEKQLKRLSYNGIISEYKFNGLFYCYKQTPVSEWKIVQVTEDLDHLMDLLNYVRVR